MKIYAEDAACQYLFTKCWSWWKVAYSLFYSKWRALLRALGMIAEVFGPKQFCKVVFTAFSKQYQFMDRQQTVSAQAVRTGWSSDTPTMSLPSRVANLSLSSKDTLKLVLLTTISLWMTLWTSGRAPSSRWFWISQLTDSHTTFSSILTPANCWALQNTLITKAVNLEVRVKREKTEYVLLKLILP